MKGKPIMASIRHATGRYRIEYRQGKWYCILYGSPDEDGKRLELDASPGGTEADAEHFMYTHKRYGAWTRS
jgi:hypothetical protein